MSVATGRQATAGTTWTGTAEHRKEQGLAAAVNTTGTSWTATAAGMLATAEFTISVRKYCSVKLIEWIKSIF